MPKPYIPLYTPGRKPLYSPRKPAYPYCIPQINSLSTEFDVYTVLVWHIIIGFDHMT